MDMQDFVVMLGVVNGVCILMNTIVLAKVSELKVYIHENFEPKRKG